MYTARDALKFVYPLIAQHGASRAIGANNFLFAINFALNEIYNYGGYMWTWQHTKDAFHITGKKHIKLITRRPVQTVDKFYTGQRVDVDSTTQACACEDNLPDDEETCCACDCPCGPNCADLHLTRILPNNQLCENEYQVSGSEIKGMGGLNGRIIKVNLQTAPDTLRVTYFRGVKHVTQRDEIIPVPDNFIHILALFIAAQIVPLYGIMAEQQDLNYLALARKELDALKAQDNIFPKDMRFNPSYPFSGEQTGTPTGMGTRVVP